MIHFPRALSIDGPRSREALVFMSLDPFDGICIKIEKYEYFMAFPP